MTNQPRSFVEVVPLVGAPGRFTYSVPEPLAGGVVRGRRVLVPFGRRQEVGVVVAEADGSGRDEVRPIEALLDDGPLVLPEVLDLCVWAAEYYAAALALVLRAALPPGAHGLASEQLGLTESGREALKSGGVAANLRQALRATELDEAQLVPKALRARLAREGLVEIRRGRAPGGEVPMVEIAVDIAPAGAEVNVRHRALYATYALVRRHGRLPLDELRRALPQARASLARLCSRGFVRIERAPREAAASPGTNVTLPPPVLMVEQAAAVDRLAAALGAGPATFLLEGVTGSGKTEVYLQLIERARRGGGTALVLVPEIALTPQLAGRFRARFGVDVAVLHSGLTERDRASEWHRIRRGAAPLVVGARSAVFAPLAKPAVIIVDEEHDPSFKQESGLRYHGRDLAVMRGKLAGAVVVLGTATPSLETLENVNRGRYERLRLSRRVDDRPLPVVELIDLRGRGREKAEGGVAPSGLLSAQLVTALRQTHEQAEQAIVFLNRRGHSTALFCRDCGEVRRCPDCAVAFTWHERRQWLVCHYCGRRERAPDECGHCRSTRLLFTGAGTEKLEDELAAALPGARVGRLDRDTAGNVRRLGAILDRFSRRELDVLVGTQMVTKGHDFPLVTLVCVLLADAGLHQPDFRAAERTAQLLTQVAGRAGRGVRPGRVLVQTFHPEAPAVAAVVGHDYEAFARVELAERRAVGYPPFRRLCLVRVEGEDAQQAERLASELAARARPAPGVEVLGPAPAPLAMLRGRHRFQVLLKAEKVSALQAALRRLASLRLGGSGKTRVVFDVDPVDMS